MFCKTCPHYQPRPVQTDLERGECRMGAPVLMWAALAPDKEPRTGWPLVNDSNWCSHHPERQMAFQMFVHDMAERKNAEVQAEHHKARGGKVS